MVSKGAVEFRNKLGCMIKGAFWIISNGRKMDYSINGVGKPG